MKDRHIGGAPYALLGESDCFILLALLEEDFCQPAPGHVGFRREPQDAAVNLYSLR